MERGEGSFLAIFLCVLAALLAVGLPLFLGWFDPQNPRQPIAIESLPTPVRGRLHTIKGTASFPGNQPLKIWIVVEGLSGGGRGGYWPQGEVRWNSRQRSSWSCDIALGSPDEREVGRYKIWAVLAEPRAHAAFARFVRTKLLKGSDVPIEDWPTRVKRVISMEVERKPMRKPLKTSRGIPVSDNDRRRPAWCKWPPETS